MLRQSSVTFGKFLPYAMLIITAGAELCPIQSISPTCKLVHEIELSMDQTVNPCEDIYAYACNNVGLLRNRNHHHLTKHQVNLNLILAMDSLYPQPSPEANANQSIFDKAYIYYKSCVNEKDTNDIRYFELIKPGQDLEWPIVEELQAYHRIGGGYFDSSAWPAGQFDVYALLGQLHSYGLNNVLVQQGMPDADSDLVIGQPASQLFYYFTLPDLMATLMGWGLPAGMASKYATDIMATQEYWRGLHQTNMLSSEYSVIAYQSLKQQFPYLAVFLENVYQHKFRDSFMVKLYGSRYFEFLLHKRWSAAEAWSMCNYLMLRFLVHLRQLKAHDFTKLNCIDSLRRNLDFPVNLLYYQYVYKPEELHYNAEIYKFFNRTLHYTMETLLENHWAFSSRDLDELRAYMPTISLNVGNFPRNLRTSEIEKFYRNIPALDVHKYYENHLHLLRHAVSTDLLPHTNQSFSTIAGYSGSSTWPFYNKPLRLLVLPFGALQPPLYHHTYDPIFKWSSLGYELVYGLLINAVPTLLKFKQGYEQSECMSRMRSEARAMSARVAYKAYVKEQGVRLQPHFSNISWKQLFFLNIYQRWCIPKGAMDDISTMLQSDMDFDGFDEAFQCPAKVEVIPKSGSFYYCYRFYSY